MESNSNPGQETYEVHKLTSPIIIDGNWDKPAWRNIDTINISRYMGEKPLHMPRTQARAAYDNNNIYIIFRVEDQYVRAVADKIHGNVWEDSCVEFFFTPGTDITRGYMNLETNCGGTFLFNFQAKQGEGVVRVEKKDYDKIEIAHSLPRIIDPEITAPVTWTLEYHLPFSIIEKYFQVKKPVPVPFKKPVPGTIWRANFYKCGDKTSHPHWLTWSQVNYPRPNFHLPEFFGQLVFQ